MSSMVLTAFGNDNLCEQTRWRKILTSVGTGLATGVGSGLVTYYNLRELRKHFSPILSDESLSGDQKKAAIAELFHPDRLRHDHSLLGIIKRIFFYETFNWSTFSIARLYILNKNKYESRYKWLSFCASMVSYYLTRTVLDSKMRAALNSKKTENRGLEQKTI